MDPEECEGLSEHRLRNATDAVQTYLSGLHSQARPAPRMGRPSTENPENIDTPGEPEKAASQSASVKKQKQSKPVKKASRTSSVQKEKLGSVPLDEQQS